MSIRENISRILRELPAGVQLLTVAKARTLPEILEAIEAGTKIIGENYVQEAEKIYQIIGNRVEWHFIGHLQSNKVKKAVKLFDMIQTVDSLAIAGEIDARCAQISKVMPVLIEVNSGREKQKAGVFPENVESLAKELSILPNIKLLGLMTMGPDSDNPEDSRPYFRTTRQIFEQIKQSNLPNTEMRYLSMGMSSNYKVAIQEGADMVRIGRLIFE
ncbi:MAG: YggS family pyridoxal phosphate-dependent enzyme [Chloroflexota bacterium]